MQESVMSLNDFGMPKVFEQSDAEYISLIRLILLEPGKFQSHPNMGIGIKSKYRFVNDENFMQSLQNDLTNQINSFLPQLKMTEVALTNKNNVLGIIINTTEGSYVLAYNSIEDTINTSARYVLDDL